MKELSLEECRMITQYPPAVEGRRINKPASHFAARFASDEVSKISSWDGDELNASVAAEESFNEAFAERYFDVWDKWPIQQLTRRVENNWLNALVDPGDRVLLIGSGGGREIEALISRGVEIVAMDLSQAMLEVGRDRFPDPNIKWIKGDAHQPPEHLRGFDHAIGVGCVLCYLPNPGKALENIRDTLRVGGRLTVGVMNKEHFTELEGSRVLGNGRVRNVFTCSELRAMMQRCGFVVQSIKGHRFFIDSLPDEWNKHFGNGEASDALMEEMVSLEEKLTDAAPAEMAKHLWVTARAI